MSAADLLAYVGATSTDQAFAAECWDTAAALVAKHVGGALIIDPPTVPDGYALDGGTP